MGGRIYASQLLVWISLIISVSGGSVPRFLPSAYSKYEVAFLFEKLAAVILKRNVTRAKLKSNYT